MQTVTSTQISKFSAVSLCLNLGKLVGGRYIQKAMVLLGNYYNLCLWPEKDSCLMGTSGVYNYTGLPYMHAGNNDDSEDSNAMLMPKDTEHLYPNDSVTLEVGSGHTARISQQDKADLDTDSGIDSHCESMSGIQTNSYLSTVF